MRSGQLPLWSPTVNPSRFDNFETEEHNSNIALLQSLQGYIHNPETTPFFVHGESGSGKTHLLHSAAHLSRILGEKSVIYCDCRSASMTPAVLLGCIDFACFLLDNIDAWSNSEEGEKALFSIVEQAKTRQLRLVITAQQSPKNSQFELADLVSRLSSGVVFQLNPLTDAGKFKVLQQNLEARNLTVDSKVLDYLLTHFSRDNHSLFAALDKLDRASMIEQRKLTVPFVQQVLS